MAVQGTLRLVIDFKAPEPLWRQVADVIRHRIDTGEYPGCSAIPSIMKLTAEFGVAEATVRKALDALKQDGVLIAAPRRGTFVCGN
jgi:DNA-binding GntR family transcriptional regulator